MKKLTCTVIALLLAFLVPMMGFAEVTYDSPDLAWRKNTDPATFSLFFNMSWAPFDVWGTDHVSQQVTTDTGISFEATKAQDENHMVTLVATGEYPDAFFVYGDKNTDVLEDENVCWPWDELIELYAPEFMDLIDPSEIALATKDDGHFYTLYTHVRNQDYWDDPTQGVSYGQTVLAFRDDIMEELGNPEIKTMDDFYNVLVQVKEQYPDMVPYLQQRLNADYIPGCFGVDYAENKGGGTVVDGELIYAFADEGPITDYLLFANKLMREGLMSQEGLTYEQEQAKAAVLSGNVFCWSGQAFDVDQYNEALAATPGNNIYYTVLRGPLTVDGEVRMDFTYGTGGFAGFYISKACKDPARLIALMEYMKSPYGDRLTQWGVEGLDYELLEGYPVQNDTYSWKERGDNVWYFQAAFATENQKALAKAVANPLYGQTAHLVLDFKPLWHYDVAMALVKNPEAGTKLGDIRTAMKELKDNSFTAAIIAGTEEECKTLIADYFANLEKIGLSEYNEFINTQYQANLAKIAVE